MLIIAEGLVPGERIATDGAFKLREGVLVKDVGPAGSPGRELARGNASGND
jgi:hypothetical protein